MRVIATVRDLARLAAVGVLAVWFAFYRPAGVLGGTTGYVLVEGRSMLPAYRTGDLVIAVPRSAYGPGDVVVYTVPAGEPGAGGRVIHRIVRAEPDGSFVTRGDNNGWDDSWRPTAGDILGSAALAVPGAGPAVALVRSPVVAGLLGALIAFAVLEPLLGGSGGRRRRNPDVTEVAAGS